MTQQNNFFTKAILEDHARCSSCIVLTQNHPRWWLWAILFVLKPFLMVMHKKLSQKRKKLLAISFHIFLIKSATSKQLRWKIGLFLGHGDIGDSVLVGVTEWGCVHRAHIPIWDLVHRSVCRFGMNVQAVSGTWNDWIGLMLHAMMHSCLRLRLFANFALKVKRQLCEIHSSLHENGSIIVWTPIAKKLFDWFKPPHSSISWL